MKMRNLAFACMIYFVAASIAMAASIGDSIIPLGDMNVAVTVEDNLIFDKDFELSDTLVSFGYDNVNQVYGKCSIGITDYINVYTKIGASNCGEITQRFRDGTTIDIECEHGLLWGAGANGSCPIPIIKGLSLGMDLQYNSWKCTVDEVGRSGQIASNISGQVNSKELQMALFISQKIDLKKDKLSFIPYGGGMFNWFESKSEKTIRYELSRTSYERRWELSGKERWGIVAGADIVSGENFVVNLEGRLLGESAATAGASWKF